MLATENEAGIRHRSDEHLQRRRGDSGQEEYLCHHRHWLNCSRVRCANGSILLLHWRGVVIRACLVFTARDHVVTRSHTCTCAYSFRQTCDVAVGIQRVRLFRGNESKRSTLEKTTNGVVFERGSDPCCYSVHITYHYKWRVLRLQPQRPYGAPLPK